MKKLFLDEAEENKVFPIGAGIWLRIHPEDRIKSPYTSWEFDDTTTRMPEFTAPGLGQREQPRRPSTSKSARTPAACSMPWAAPAAA